VLCGVYCYRTSSFCPKCLTYQANVLPPFRLSIVPCANYKSKPSNWLFTSESVLAVGSISSRHRTRLLIFYLRLSLVWGFCLVGFMGRTLSLSTAFRYVLDIWCLYFELCPEVGSRCMSVELEIDYDMSTVSSWLTIVVALSSPTPVSIPKLLRQSRANSWQRSLRKIITIVSRIRVSFLRIAGPDTGAISASAYRLNFGVRPGPVFSECVPKQPRQIR